MWMRSLSATATTVVATVAMARGGEASMWDGGMFYVYFSFAFPLIMFASVQLVELWLDSMPSQVRSCDITHTTAYQQTFFLAHIFEKRK